MSESELERVFQGVWIPKEIWDSQELSWMERCLLAEIRSLEGEDGCYAGNEWLAGRFGTSKEAIHTSISRLRKAGWIVDLGFDGRRRRIAVFVKGNRESMFTQHEPPRSPSMNPHVHSGGTPEFTQPPPSNEGKSTGKNCTVAIAQAVEIYQAYPKKVGRPVALKSIAKALTKHSFEFLLDRTKLFAETRNGDLEFCPNPSTWFNQERFNDDPSTWKRTPDSDYHDRPRKYFDNQI